MGILHFQRNRCKTHALYDNEKRHHMDMKEIIVVAARKLILEKKVKKLTVKDIVEECQI